MCCGGCGLHDSLVALLGQTRENADAHKSLDLPPPQWYNPMRRGHHPPRANHVRPGSWVQQFAFVVCGPHIRLRLLLLTFWPVSPLACPPPLFSSPGLLSLPVPLTLPHFCSCVSCVSLCSGFMIGFPAPQSRAGPGHDCSIFSTRLAVPSPAPWGGHVNSKLPTFRGSNQRVPLPGLLGLLLSPSLLRFASSRN